MELKTALYDTHVKYKGKLVPFAGYLLPVQYERGVIAEHMAVREACGLFDVSHMGEILCEGEGALACLNHLLTNDFTSLADGRARYSPMCNEEGGIVDDLIVYRIRERHYLIVVNASNKDKDFAWMQSHRLPGAVFTDLSEQVGQIALQGPKALEVLEKLVPAAQLPGKYYSFVRGVKIPAGDCAGAPEGQETAGGHGGAPDARTDGIECLISRTGYTGEDGFELYMAAKQTPLLWEILMAAGAEEGLVPCGLGARDTLRLEAAMPLYGHEMDDGVTPLEAGLGFAVKMDKADFIGKAAIEAKGGPKRCRVGLQVTGRGIIREHETVYADGRRIGVTTSGTHAPYLGYPVAMALVDVSCSQPGTAVYADVRGRRVEAEIVPLPFYKREK